MTSISLRGFSFPSRRTALHFSHRNAPSIARLEALRHGCSSFPLRALSTSPRLRLKEDEEKHEPGSAEAKESKKQEHLKKQDEGKGHWERELASSGEEAVKADRQDMHHSDKDIEQLQHRTAKGAEQEKDQGKR